MDIKAVQDPENGNRHYVIDEDHKMRTLVSDEAIKDCSSYQTDIQGAINFYKDNIEIALRNKSADVQSGYYQSHIYRDDVCPE